jgi:hypothetical protein
MGNILYVNGYNVKLDDACVKVSFPSMDDSVIAKVIPFDVNADFNAVIKLLPV